MGRKSKFINIPSEVLEATANSISKKEQTYKGALEVIKKDYPELKLEKARPASLSAFLKKNGYIKVEVEDEFIAYVINQIFKREVENMGETFVEIESGTQSMGDSGLDSYGYIGAYLAVGELFYIEQYLFDEELGKDDPTMNELISFIKKNRQNQSLSKKDVQDYSEDNFIAGASEQEQQMSGGMNMESFMSGGPDMAGMGGENSDMALQMRDQMMNMGMGMGTMDMGDIDIDLEMSGFGDIDIEADFQQIQGNSFSDEFTGDLEDFESLIEADSGCSEELLLSQLEEYKEKTEGMKDVLDSDLLMKNYKPIAKSGNEELRYTTDISGLKGKGE